MPGHNLSREYGRLSPRERFRLILAAGTRRDDVEQRRLILSGQRTNASIPEHAPYAQAFDDLGSIIYLELGEAAAYYSDAWKDADLAWERSRHPIQKRAQRVLWWGGKA